MSSTIKELLLKTDVTKPLKPFKGWRGSLGFFLFVVAFLATCFVLAFFVNETGPAMERWREAAQDTAIHWWQILVAGIVVAFYARIDQDWMNWLGRKRDRHKMD